MMLGATTLLGSKDATGLRAEEPDSLMIVSGMSELAPPLRLERAFELHERLVSRPTVPIDRRRAAVPHRPARLAVRIAVRHLPPYEARRACLSLPAPVDSG